MSRGKILQTMRVFRFNETIFWSLIWLQAIIRWWLYSMWSSVNKLRLIWRHTKQIIAINIRVRLSSIVGHVKGTLSLAIQFATTLQSRITSSHISSAQGQVELLKYHHHHQHWRWNLYEIYLCHIQLDSTSTPWRRDTPHMWESAVSFIHMSNITIHWSTTVASDHEIHNHFLFLRMLLILFFIFIFAERSYHRARSVVECDEREIWI